MDTPGDYNGPREHAGIVSYLEKISGPASTELKTASEVRCCSCLSWTSEPTLCPSHACSAMQAAATHARSCCLAKLSAGSSKHRTSLNTVCRSYYCAGENNVNGAQNMALTVPEATRDGLALEFANLALPADARPWFQGFRALKGFSARAGRGVHHRPWSARRDASARRTWRGWARLTRARPSSPPSWPPPRRCARTLTARMCWTRRWCLRWVETLSCNPTFDCTHVLDAAPVPELGAAPAPRAARPCPVGTLQKGGCRRTA